MLDVALAFLEPSGLMENRIAVDVRNFNHAQGRQASMDRLEAVYGAKVDHVFTTIDVLVADDNGMAATDLLSHVHGLELGELQSMVDAGLIDVPADADGARFVANLTPIRLTALGDWVINGTAHSGVYLDPRTTGRNSQ